jgi:hypothetical protein
MFGLVIIRLWRRRVLIGGIERIAFVALFDDDRLLGLMVAPGRHGIGVVGGLFIIGCGIVFAAATPAMSAVPDRQEEAA